MTETQKSAESANERAPRLRPLLGAKCEKCGSGDVAPLPTFATGSGTACRPIAADVLCKRCGHIALPVL